GNIGRYAPRRKSAPKYSASRGHDNVVALVCGPRRCTVVAPPTRTNPIPAWTEAIELKSAGVSHFAAQTRANGPHGPLTTSLLRPTRGSKSNCRRRGRAVTPAARQGPALARYGIL